MDVTGVAVTYKKQTACPSHFARIVLDFEPADAYTFVNAVPAGAMQYPDSQARFVPVVDETVHERLETVFGAGPPPVRVTLRQALDHPVDSSDASFRAAALHAVREALDRAGHRLDERIRIEETAGALGPPDRVPYLRTLLDEPRHRFQALDLCGDLLAEAPRDAAALLPALARLVDSPDDREALRAVRVLTTAPHDRARELVARAVERPAGQARDRAVLTLAERGDPRAAEPLAELLARDRLPKDVEWPVHAMKAHASVVLPPIRSRVEAAVPGALEPFLFELVCRISRWGATAAPLAPSLRALASGADGWTSRELARALDRIAPPR
ncbi:HEAT repeat domain-containing protein [Actinomadura sp. WMMB 499]|uniref:HEAT repeat domain-containing protein n=1 Tax=Actinomadura sp. WMMB 499 TaxID=1219491 RepID=UPI00124878A2|nr:HEAT repeat domain-containing protein [Actinomadura sp. WMMB 499]QFG25536.1 hypothetical protein F7P10_34740 [Actinomadura sp. WMMB 499]